MRNEARFFSFVVPEHLDGDDIVGIIMNTIIYADDVRRLNSALSRDPADDGPEVKILSWR